MLRRIAAIVIAVMLTLPLANSALAAYTGFGNLSLIRVVLNQTGGTTEIATDLGNVTTVLAGGTFGGGTSAFTAQTGGTDFANLYVAYYAVDQTNRSIWLTGLSPVSVAGKSTTVSGLTTNIWSYYNSTNILASAGTTVLADASYANSYRVRADQTNNFGSFGTLINAATQVYTEASLATVTTAPITQNLYKLNNYGAASSASNPWTLVATITTNSNGSTTISPVAGDTTAPVVTISSASTLTSTSATVNISFTATDAVGVTGYLLNESPTKPTDLVTGWTAVTPSTNYGGSASYTFTNVGSGASSSGTVYVWAKDAAGNVSSVPVTSPQNVQVTIQKPACNSNSGIYYFYLLDAFTDATNSNTIKAMINTFTESPLAYDRLNVTATVNGGYDALPSGNNTGVTTIQGPFVIKNGRLNVTRVAIKQP